MKKILVFLMALILSIVSLIGCTPNGQGNQGGNNNQQQSGQDDPGQGGQTDPIDDNRKGVDFKNYLNENNSYVIGQLGKDVMPIMVYISPTEAHSVGFKSIPSMINDKYYTLMKDCGINVVDGFNVDDARSIQNLEFCKKYGMAYIHQVSLENFTRYNSATKSIECYDNFSDDDKQRIKESFTTSATKYSDYWAFAGIRASDEEGVDVFPGLSSAEKIFSEVCPDKLFFLNLLGQMALPGSLKYGQYFSRCEFPSASTTYDEYLESYVSNFNEKFICFDSYPIIKSGIQSPALNNISRIAKVAKDNNKAFGYCTQASLTGESNSKLPNQEEQYWATNVSLCFGAKFLTLFTFFHPNDYAHTANFSTCIDYEGNVTDYYYIVKNALSQISMMDEYLMNATWKGVMQTKTKAHSANQTTDPSVIIDSFKQCTGVSSDAHVLVGCFDHNGKMVLFVFNNTVEANTNVLLNFSENCKFKMIKENVVSEVNTSDKVFLVQNLKAGQCALLVQE